MIGPIFPMVPLLGLLDALELGDDGDTDDVIRARAERDASIEAKPDCDWCANSRGASLEAVDGGKLACASCASLCHFCQRPHVRMVPLASMQTLGEPLAIGGEIGLCEHHYSTEYFGISGAEPEHSREPLPDTEIGF